jgi:ribonuclease BN (tRNA processing enzyme)
MRLTVVGSADAFNALGRSHSCYLIEGNGLAPLMIDFGATALGALRKLGREPTELGGIAFTHLHGDHLGGMPFLLIDGMYNARRTAPLPVVGPVRSAQRIDEVFRAAYGFVADQPRPFDLPIREIAPGDAVELCGARIEAFAADHMDPPDQALCLRVRAGGKTVAFSGDTRICPGLFAAAEGADLLVAECTGLAPPTGHHCTWQEWRHELAHVKARRVLLSHLGRAVRERAAELLAEAPPGVDLAFADDGMTVDL